MKKIIAGMLAVFLLLSVCACGKQKTEENTASKAKEEVTIFAAASLTEALNQLSNIYCTENPNIKLIFNFDSSGTLKTQIQEGAECDLFFSAATKQMDQLDIKAAQESNPDVLDFVQSETRVNLLENQVVLAVPEGNPSAMTSFADLGRANLIALGNADVPVGSYSLKLLRYLGLDIATLEAEGRVTYGSNVKEVTTQVSEGVVDCGLVYATDAFTAGLKVVDKATAEMCGPAIYPAAVLKNTKHGQAAKDFLRFLQTPEATAVFQGLGFTTLA